MKELVTQTQAETVLRIIAAAAPIAGIIGGAIVGLARRRVLWSTAVGLVIGLAGAVIFGLWRMYIWFGGRYGYTSVASLAVQLVIFIGLGIAIGAIVRTFYQRDSEIPH